jgi:hypothetical protein
VRLIPLTRGLSASVDDEDYEDLARHRWHAHDRGDGHYYAVRRAGPRGAKATIRMHVAIAGERIDHVNGDTLDNRRSNLRPASTADNNKARRKYGAYGGRPTSSRWKGVSLRRRTGRWEASIQSGGVAHYIGSFGSEREAALAYNEAASRLHGEFAVMNECD